MKRAEVPQENPFGYEKIGKLILRFSTPAIASNLLNAIYNIVDQIFIGHGIGYDGIAATTIAFPMVTVVAAISIMLGVGCSSSFNLNLGAGDRERAEKTAGAGLSVMVVSGLVLMTVFLVFLSPLLYLFGATDDIIELATNYTLIVTYGVPFQMITVGACYLIRADGSPNYSMISMVSGAVFNLIFDPVFMFGFGWGIKGIALATTLGQVLSAILALSYIIRGMKTVDLSKKVLKPVISIIKTICSLGFASFTNQIAITIMNVVLNNTLRYYGNQSHYGSTVALGAVGAISKINMIFLSSVIGVGQGCQPIHSFNYGAKNYARVKEALKMALICSMALSVTFFAFFQLFPRLIISIFGQGSDEYFEFATRYLRIFMFMTFSNFLQPSASSYFAATGRAKMGAFISMSRQIIFLIPLLLILPAFLGIDGVVFAGPVADTVSATLAVVFFTREFKRLNKSIRLPGP